MKRQHEKIIRLLRRSTADSDASIDHSSTHDGRLSLLHHAMQLIYWLDQLQYFPFGLTADGGLFRFLID